MSPRPSQAVRPALRPVPPQGLSFAFPLRLPESGTGAGGEKAADRAKAATSPTHRR